MTRLPYRTTPLGELIAAAFDRAALLSPDPKEVSRIAVQSITTMLRGALRVSISPATPRGLTGMVPQSVGLG